MGAGQSVESHEAAKSPEEMSQLLAHRFATKCFTPLELTHFKDNFNSIVLDQGGLHYWNEEILSRFLGIPDGAGERGAESNGNADHSLDAGPVIFRMVSYLGAFPFQNTLAPSLLTFEAMVKVVVLLTERYSRVLRRGRKDRIKLLFGSLADVGRKAVPEIGAEEKKPHDRNGQKGDMKNGASHTSHASGFAVDEPASEDEEEDDDDLALAALESLDAIEVFKHDQRVDRTVYETRVSVETFRRLLMLLLVIAPLQPMGTVSKLTTNLSGETIEATRQQVDSILATFTAVEHDAGIKYNTFSKVITQALPFLFDPLTPLFEHLLFSKNLDLSRRRGSGEKSTPSPPISPPMTPVPLPGSFESNILDSPLFSHLSFFLATSSSVPNFFRNGTRMHPIFSSAVHGESLTSFSHHVLTWKAPSLLLLKGLNTSPANQDTVIIGAYLPQAWKSSSSSSSPSSRASEPSDASNLPCLFQLSPDHVVLRGHPSYTSLKSNLPVASFSNKTGIALGCMIPPPSRSSLGGEKNPTPAGGGSLLIDSALENATFVVSDGVSGEGVFLPPSYPTSSSGTGPTTTSISIFNLEVWGIVPESQEDPNSASGGGTTAPVDAIAQQRKDWNFEAREAERRRDIHLGVGGGDSEEQTGRALLEMAGIVGDSKYKGGRPR